MNIKLITFVLFVLLTVFIAFPNNTMDAQDDTDFDKLNDDALKLLNDGKVADAEKMFNSALKLNKSSFRSYFYLAVIYAIYAEETKDEEAIKKQMVKRACEYLKLSVSAGFRETNKISLEKRFAIIKDAPEYNEAMKMLNYLILKEASWTETSIFEIDFKFPKEFDVEKRYPLLIYLALKDKVEAESFLPWSYVQTNGMACATLSYSPSEYDVSGGTWSEFSEKRVRNTLQEIIDKNEKRENLDFDRVYVCGIRHSGYRALTTYLKYSDVFAGAFTFNAPIVENSEIFKLLKDFKNKASLRITAVHSKKDTLSFAKAKKAWEDLKKEGVNADFKIEDGLIFGTQAIDKYEKIIFNFINKELPPKTVKKEEGLQTKKNKPEGTADKPEAGADKTDKSDETEKKDTNE